MLVTEKTAHMGSIRIYMHSILQNMHLISKMEWIGM